MESLKFTLLVPDLSWIRALLYEMKTLLEVRSSGTHRSPVLIITLAKTAIVSSTALGV